MNRTALLTIAVALAGTLLVSTGAVPLFDGPTDDISNNISLYPSDSPDGKYAYIDDETGELVVDISASNPNVEGPVGVSPDSVTTFENVFRIHYNGSQYANVWLTHESDAVTFSARDKSIQSESSAVTLGPNQSVGVNVHVDTTGDVQSIRADEMTVHARVAEPSDTRSSGGETDGETDSAVLTSVEEQDDPDSLTVTVTEPTTGERDVTVRNLTPGRVVEIDLGGLYIVDGAITLDSVRFRSTTTGDANLTFSQQTAGSAPVEPIGNGSGIEPLGYFTLNHSVPNSAVENVAMRFSANWSYLDANGIDPAEVRMLRYGTNGWTVIDTEQQVGTTGRAHFVADSPGLSTFAVGVRTSRFVTSDVTVSPETIRVGETATVTAEVSNRGAIAGRMTVTLRRNGSAVGNRTVSLDAGANTTVRFDVSPDTPGTYTVAVDGTAGGTLTVDSPTTPTRTEEPPETPTLTATPADGGLSTGQPPNETVPVSDEAAGFDVLALGGLVAIVALVAVVAGLRRRQDS
jgi:PGF-pre-PGF domain-containing protein